MLVRIHHPKILALLLALIACGTAVAVISANSWSSVNAVYTPLPQPERPAPLSADEKADAVTLVRNSGIVESINGNQAWEVKQIIARSDQRLVDFYAVWSTAVDHSGPWYVLRCGGTRQGKMEVRWTDIRGLLFTVNTVTDEIVGYSPDSPPDGDHQPSQGTIEPSKNLKIYDTATWQAVYDGPVSGAPGIAQACPDVSRYQD